MFAEVILPLPLQGTFTYRLTGEEAERVKPGMRVTVQFGKRKIYTALVRRVHDVTPEGYAVKTILSILDKTPVVVQNQFMLWEWISDYYLCTQGEVFGAALPAGLRIESETRVRAVQSGADAPLLTDRENLLLQAIHDNPGIRVTELQQAAGRSDITPVIKSMLDKGTIALEESLTEKYKPKTKTFISLASDMRPREKTEQLVAGLARSPAKCRLILAYLALVPEQAGDEGGIGRDVLLEKAETSTSVLNDLLKQGILESHETEVTRIFTSGSEPTANVVLNSAQEKALEAVTLAFAEKDVVLLHGVTSSGKTEIYIRLIREALSRGKQVLYLLPEIALTAQIIARLRLAFGSCVAVYHSRFSDSERVETWKKLLSAGSGIQIILGVRSAVFLPFTNLGLVIVDEEHENTYKQFDPAPRYHARDTAIMLARLHQATVLLGTATPAVETYYNCMTGKYGLVELQERYSDLELPEVQVVNTRVLKHRKQMQSHFSPALLDGIGAALDKKEQVILFQNRRGFSLFLQCDQCGEIPHCRRCDVSLTYHKLAARLTCHYCGYSIEVPDSCPACGSKAIKMQGFGTEKIAEEIVLFFPQARVLRMDLDTMRSKKSYEQVIAKFESQESDILVGTQMVSKGLDFENVSLVGIINADTMMNFPDFRAFERSYQLMAQVSGRAGRKNKRGRVIIQTSDHQHPVIGQVVRNDYLELYRTQLEERRKFNYPPFFRLVKITLKHRDRELLDKAASFLAQALRASVENVMGPEYPLIGRIHNFYLKSILVKIQPGSLSVAKIAIAGRMGEIVVHPLFRSVQVVADVDPY